MYMDDDYVRLWLEQFKNSRPPKLLIEHSIDIVYCLKEKNMSLFLSCFFEGCGIFSTTRELRNVPKDLKLSKKTICLLDEESINQINSNQFVGSVNFVRSTMQLENDLFCSYDFTEEGCKKILNKVCSEWGMSLEETEVLNQLLSIFIKNNFWNVVWLGYEIGSSSDIVTSYVVNRCQMLRNDLNSYKESCSLSSDYKWHIDYMSLYSEFFEINSFEYLSLDKFKVYDEIIAKFNSKKNKLRDTPGLDYFVATMQAIKGTEEWSVSTYKKMGEKYSSSVCLAKYAVEKLKFWGNKYYSESTDYLDLAKKIDPSNRYAIFNSLLLIKNYEGITWRFGSVLNELKSTFVDIPVEAFTSIADFWCMSKYYQFYFEFLTKFIYDREVYQQNLFSYENFYNCVVDGRPFEYLFEDMAFGNARNTQIEDAVKIKLKENLNNVHNMMNEYKNHFKL